MRVLLVGGGGREHAIGWAIARSPRCSELLSLPGNPGLAGLGGVVEGIDPLDVGAMAAFAAHQAIDLVVVGPEGPLAAGAVDAMRSMGIPAFGPTRAAARLEASKAFAKDVMARAGVPTGGYAAFIAAGPAIDHLSDSPGPFVVKADGLAAGKGVLVTEDRSEAARWVEHCLTGSLGGEGASVVIEEYLDGPELSIFAICDGSDAVAFQPARDYKRLSDGDAGPNTGGMGSYSPVADLPDGLVDDVMATVVAPTLRTMEADGIPYTGVLYVGLALTSSGPKVIEFNCRLGDPETQAILPLLETDLLDLMAAVAQGRLPDTPLEWSTRAAVNVVLAAHGYPDQPRGGDAISGLDTIDDPEVLVFHAGTALDDRRVLRTAGGRVLSVVGLGDTVPEARERAYAAASTIRWKGMVARTDIAG